MTDHDRLSQSDAAYAMGALDPADAAEFEAHMATCGECRARVAEARDTLMLLSALAPGEHVGDDHGADDHGADDLLPDTLLPGLLRRVSRERNRRRVLAGAAAAAVAAVAATVLVAFWPGSSGSSPDHPTVAARDFVAVQKTPVKANASLISKPWGTQIDVHCSYAVGVTHAYRYRLQVTEVNGDVEDAGSWVVPAHDDVSYVAGTALALDRIKSVEIVTYDGKPMLQLTN
jgi:hypothetical protein